MKKILLLFLFSINMLTVYAFHVIGGTIHWKCLSNGQYQFFMEVYRDCSGTHWRFDNETIDIVGNPLPTNGITSFTVEPDTVRFINSNNGDYTTGCTSEYGQAYTCANGDHATIQVFYYQSQPITLTGTPPANGWKFYWEAPCCRSSNLKNLITNGSSTLLRAVMYPITNHISVDSCLDSSPEFSEYPFNPICNRTLLKYNHMGKDKDLDQLVYSWSSVITPPQAFPRVVPYAQGYSINRPTPDTSFNINNIAAMIDSSSGNIKLAVYDLDTWYLKKYLMVTKLDSYRDGIKIATVFREVPIFIIDCPDLQSGNKNNTPKLSINGEVKESYEYTVVAGRNICLPISIIDNDSNGVGNNKQRLTLTAGGSLFANDLSNPGNCAYANLGACAVLQNTSPSLDTSFAPAQYSISGEGNIQTQFLWQTSANHLANNGGPKSYHFVLKVSDDHCPIPASSSRVISVTVVPSQPRLNCVKRETNGTRIIWDTTGILSSSFLQWKIYRSFTQQGSFTLLDSVGNYNTTSYIDPSTADAYYYITVENGSASLPTSDTLREIANSLTLQNLPSCFFLDWDSSQLSSLSFRNVQYNIYREFPIGSGFQFIDSVRNKTSYCDPLEACNDSVSYYVEKIDLQNSSCHLNLNTVGIKSSFTMIDTSISLIGDTMLQANATIGQFQWYSCSKRENIDGAITRNYVPTDSGAYAVIITQYGCRDTSNCFTFQPIGLSEVELEESISLYPNPTTGEVNLRFSETYQKLYIQIRNIHGQLIKELSYQSYQESLSLELGRSPGIYFINLQNEKGEQVNLKVVKQ